MRRPLPFVLLIVLAALSAESIEARRPERFDALAANPANGVLVPEASDPALVRVGSVVQEEPRLGVPTFVWAAPRPVPAGVTGPEDAARRYLAEYARLYRLDPSDAAAASVAHVHDTGRGLVIVAFDERVAGIEVFRESIKVAMGRDLSLVALSGYLGGAPARAGRNFAASYRLDAVAAIAAAFKDMTGDDLAPSALRESGERRGAYARFDLDVVTRSGGSSAGTARIKHVVFHLPGTFVPAWYVELDLGAVASTGSALFSFVVSAVDGAILFRNDLTADAAYSYRVWAETASPFRPYDGPQGNGASPHPTGVPDGYQAPFIPPVLVTLQNGPISTNDPWLAAGATQSTGNNVDAYADLSAPDGFSAGDLRATTTSAGVFDRVYDTNVAPNASANQEMAAVTQLFYAVNFFHDWYYDSGFDEASGNAQESNFGRGGLEHDPIRAEAQDSGGTNNANMSTPSDGAIPRMQMYVWTPNTARSVTVTPPGAAYSSGTAAFGPQAFDTTGSVVLVNDGVGTTTDGCETISGAVAGKIALIDRGTCTFKQKAVNAQNAGAIGVILANNVSGAPPSMPDGSPSGTVTIPMLSVSQTDGNSIKSQLQSGPVSARLYREGAPNRDGTIDNTIVAHEWGHYISNRLIGNANGLGNNQGGGLGEGWGDFHALLLVARPEDALVVSNANFAGVYALASYVTGGSAALGGGNQAYYFGIRRYPYSTNFNKNPLTFKHITTGVALPSGPPVGGGGNNAEVHNTGEVWTTMLWECYASLLRDTLGGGARLTFAQAQQRMRDYLVAAYKLTPVDPTFVEARDALLAAANAGDPADYVLFSQAFARRGIGLRAVAPDRYSTDNSGVVESFVSGSDLAFVSATLGDGPLSCDADGILDSQETALLTITLRNVGTGSLSATTATVTSSHPSISFPSGQVVSFPASQPLQTTTASIPVHLGLLSGIQQTAFTIAYRDPGMAIPGDRTANASYRANTDLLPAASKTDDIEAAATTWTPSGSPAFSPGIGWRRLEVTPVDHRWLGPDPGSGPTDQFVISPPLQVSVSGNFGFAFRHRYIFENDATPTYYDGGVIEISTDGGELWNDIGGSAVPGYNGTLSTCCSNPLAGRLAYVKSNLGYPSFETVTLGLGAAYQGASVRVRFRVAADQASGATGWEIDDIAFTGIDNTPFATVIADRGFCLHPGGVPQSDGSGVPLHVDKNAGDPGLVDFSWGASCGNDVGGYAVYDGSLGSYYTEAPLNCNVAGTSLTGQTTGSGSRYFLVVPLSSLGSEEGSHGQSSTGERPPSASACRPAVDSQTCN